MTSHPIFAPFQARFQEKVRTRVLAFSNTDRYFPGMYWLDVFDLAVQNTFGRVHHCINTSVGGQKRLISPPCETPAKAPS